MAIGENRTITINTPNKIAMMLFEGVAGQKVSLNIVPATINSSLNYIYTPHGTLLLSIGGISSSGRFVDTFTLPVSGTYTFLANPQQSTGSMTLSLTTLLTSQERLAPAAARSRWVSLYRVRTLP